MKRRVTRKDVLQLGVTLAEYRDVIRGTTPPWPVQQVLFAVLDPIGRLLGYRPDAQTHSGVVQERSAHGSAT